MVVDCRSMFDYNSYRVRGSVNLPCSKLMTRRLQRNTVRCRHSRLNSQLICLMRAGQSPQQDRISSEKAETGCEPY